MKVIKTMKDKNGVILRKGDKIRVSFLETTVDGFAIVMECPMICTPYGDFAPHVVEKINKEKP